MSKDSARPPVFLLGEGEALLGTIRSLSREGITAYCLTADAGIAASSRWFKTWPEMAAGIRDAEDLERFLRQLSLSKAVLIPCSDFWAAAVSRLPLELLEKYPAAQSDFSVQERFLDKARFAALLQDCDVAGPHTLELSSQQSLEEVPAENIASYFLKPRNSQLFFQAFGIKALRLSSKEQALEKFTALNQQGFQLILQEYIQGPVDACFFIDGFVDAAGSFSGVFARQRKRMFPREFGNSTYMTSVSLQQVEAALEGLRAVLGRVEYRGIFSAEFKKDDRDQKFKILEVNVRPWWYIEAASICGVNVASMAYMDALGERVPEVQKYKEGVNLVYHYYDYHACASLRRAGELSLGKWAKDWFSAKSIVFSWDDPQPSLSWSWRFLKRKLSTN